MKTIVYINNDVLQYVVKKGKSYNYETVSLKQGTVLNGVIIDKNEVERKLVELRNVFKSATLVVDSSNIVVKRLTVPNLPRKSLEGVIRSEFDMGHDKQYHYDWSTLKKGKEENIVLACALPEEFLDKYIEAFDGAKIKINKIELATNGIVKYVDKNLQFKDTSMLLNIIRGNMMISVLFENGVYRLLNRNRMMCEPGTRAYADEIYSKYNTMVQFSKSQKADNQISDLYYIGLDSKTLKFLREEVEETDAEVEIHGNSYDEGEADYFYAFIGFLNGKQDIDLNRSKDEKSTSNGNTKIWLSALVIVMLLALVIGAWLYYMNKNKQLEEEIQSLEMYIEKKRESGILEILEGIIGGNEEVVSVLDQYRIVATDIECNNYWNLDLMKMLAFEIDSSTIAYDLSARKVTMDATTSSAELATTFSTDVRAKEYSDKQIYKGYIMSYNSDLIERNYGFTLTLYWDSLYSQLQGEAEEFVEGEEVISDDN